jgi:hypothetical protein
MKKRKSFENQYEKRYFATKRSVISELAVPCVWKTSHEKEEYENRNGIHSIYVAPGSNLKGQIK